MVHKLSMELFTIALCFAFIGVAVSETGFLFTVPRVLNQDAVNDLQLNLYEIDAPGEVTVRLVNVDNDTRITEKTIGVKTGESKVDIPFFVPSLEDYEARIQIEGEFRTKDIYKFLGEDKVNFKEAAPNIIFIQTDKPIYKTGQQVKFRVLPVDGKLRPLSPNTVADVWVEDPSGSRIAQWKAVDIGTGISQYDFPLSNEPNLGSWRILVSINGTEQSTSFEVKEYVLPKFEVVIKPPTYILADTTIIPVEVCAKYTYGKPVVGRVFINVTLETYSWSTTKYPNLEIDEEFDGCYKYDLNVSLIDVEFQHWYRRIHFFTGVTEKGTGITKNETIFIERTQSPLNLNFETESRQYFKPGLPYKGTVKVTNPDESVAADEPVQVCSTVSRERVLSDWWATKKIKQCRNLTSDENGIVTFTVLPQSTDTVSMSIEAKSLKYLGKRVDTKRPTLYHPHSSTYLRPWFSPSGSHLQVRSRGDKLRCGIQENVKVYFTSKDSGNFKFFYEVITGSRVLERNTVEIAFDKNNAITARSADTLDALEVQISPVIKDSRETEDNDTESTLKDEDNNCKAINEAKYVPFVGSVDIPIDVTSLHSPSFHVLVYYVRDDRETVADSQIFQVEKCLENKVDIQFKEEVKQPGEKATYTLTASPNSLCGVKIVDKSISLMDSNDQLTLDKVFQEIERLNYGRFYPRSHCNEERPQPGLLMKVSGNNIFPPLPPTNRWSSSSFEDAVTAFENTGYLVISDLTLLTRPCKSSGSTYENHHGIALAMPSSSGVRGGAPPPPPSIASRRPVAATTAFSADAAVEKNGGANTKSVVDVRTFFPETWLFDIVKVGDDGKLVQKEILPHTITEWLGSAVCINDKDGLGLSAVTNIKGFQAFFVSFTLPYSVIRGEKLPVIVTVFNYIDKCLPISLELEQSEDYILVNGTSKLDICICGGKAESFKFHVQPVKIGTINFTVHANTIKESTVCGDSEVSDAVAKDAITNPLIVEAEGFPYTEVNSHLFCPQDSDTGVYKREVSFQIPNGTVEGSERAYLILSGDIMGPTIQNIDRLIQLPTGCGEQNMVLFAPNVYVLDYLHSTGKITDKIKNKVLKNLRTGYQRELKYRHSDGSYSAFGRTDREGSMFLTAFVLRSFSQAAKYIDIDNDALNHTLYWILSKQNENGCFPEVGRTLSYSMKGGINSSASMTAYVLTSLLSANVKNEKAIKEALNCIANEKDISPYQAALFAFTAALAEDKDKAKEYLDVLFQTSVESSYFPNKEGRRSVEIETAAYAILALLELDEPLSRSLPIVRWMSKNRNNQGGFIGTQDTVLGLEALSEFASLISKDPVDLNIKAPETLTNEVSINEENRILVNKYKVPEVPGSIDIEASGTGCGLLQYSLHYNTIEPRKLEFFKLEISALRQDDCKRTSIAVCARYLPERKKSSMALIQIKMLSGMSPVKESLEALMGDRELELKRHEFENNQLVFYFDELTNKEKCFDFAIEQVIDVEERKPGIAKVFDYYAKDHEQEATYKLEDC